MNQTTEHTEHTESAEWRNPLYSAAKRFGLTTGFLWILLFCGMPVGRLLLWIPLLAAAWGAFWPREYECRPSARARAGVVVLAAGVVAVYVLVAVAGYLFFASTSRDWSGEEFTPEIWSSCQNTLHLVPGADLRPVGLRAERWLDSMAQAVFVTDETDLAHLFDTNAVDISGIVPGGTADNIRAFERGGPRWWTPSDTPLQAGELAFRDPTEAARAHCEVAVHAQPDGSHALYVIWFSD